MTDLQGLTVTRGSVIPEWIDINGHMNVAYYVLAFDKAVDDLISEGKARRIGPKPDHHGRGRAPTLYELLGIEPPEVRNGLEQLLAAREAAAASDTARFALRREVQQLTMPGAMGERFQAMGFGHGVPFEAAFLAGDLSFRL